jgi:hypothetical protein
MPRRRSRAGRRSPCCRRCRAVRHTHQSLCVSLPAGSPISVWNRRWRCPRRSRSGPHARRREADPEERDELARSVSPIRSGRAIPSDQTGPIARLRRPAPARATAWRGRRSPSSPSASGRGHGSGHSSWPSCGRRLGRLHPDRPRARSPDPPWVPRRPGACRSRTAWSRQAGAAFGWVVARRLRWPSGVAARSPQPSRRTGSRPARPSPDLPLVWGDRARPRPLEYPMWARLEIGWPRDGRAARALRRRRRWRRGRASGALRPGSSCSRWSQLASPAGITALALTALLTFLRCRGRSPRGGLTRPPTRTGGRGVEGRR